MNSPYLTLPREETEDDSLTQWGYYWQGDLLRSVGEDLSEPDVNVLYLVPLVQEDTSVWWRVYDRASGRPVTTVYPVRDDAKLAAEAIAADNSYRSLASRLDHSPIFGAW